MAAMLAAWPGGVQAEPVQGLSEAVEAALQRKIALVQHELAQDPLIVQAVRASNATSQGLSLDEIQALDRQWQAATTLTDFMKQFLTNPCAERLMDFQDAHEGYAEIFIADARGLVVGETNKTTDYYQADEDWWVQGYAGGRGRSFHGEIEYDESAMSEAIAVYVPVLDPETHQAIGVLKAVVDITAIKMEL